MDVDIEVTYPIMSKSVETVQIHRDPRREFRQLEEFFYRFESVPRGYNREIATVTVAM